MKVPSLSVIAPTSLLSWAGGRPTVSATTATVAGCRVATSRCDEEGELRGEPVGDRIVGGGSCAPLV